MGWGVEKWERNPKWSLRCSMLEPFSREKQSLTASIIHATATHEGRRQHLAPGESPELRTPRPEISQNVHVSGLPSAAF